jgi:glutaredoxin
MNVFILVTKDCNHRPLVEEQLKKMNVSYEVRYVDEHSELVKKFGAHSSPNIIVNGKVAFRANHERSLPTEGELETIFSY